MLPSLIKRSAGNPLLLLLLFVASLAWPIELTQCEWQFRRHNTSGQRGATPEQIPADLFEDAQLASEISKYFSMLDDEEAEVTGESLTAHFIKLYNTKPANLVCEPCEPCQPQVKMCPEICKGLGLDRERRRGQSSRPSSSNGREITDPEPSCPQFCPPCWESQHCPVTKSSSGCPPAPDCSFQCEHGEYLPGRYYYLDKPKPQTTPWRKRSQMWKDWRMENYVGQRPQAQSVAGEFAARPLGSPGYAHIALRHRWRRHKSPARELIECNLRPSQYNYGDYEYYMKRFKDDRTYKEHIDQVSRDETSLELNNLILNRLGIRVAQDYARMHLVDKKSYTYWTIIGVMYDRIARKHCGWSTCAILEPCDCVLNQARQRILGQVRDHGYGQGRGHGGRGLMRVSGRTPRKSIHDLFPGGIRVLPKRNCNTCFYGNLCESDTCPDTKACKLCKLQENSDDTMEDQPGLSLTNDDVQKPRYSGGGTIECPTKAWCDLRDNFDIGKAPLNVNAMRRKGARNYGWFRNSSSSSARMKNGEEIWEGQFPSLVRISIAHGKGSKMCSGVIISQNMVLTAAHCVNKKKPQDVTVYAGSIYADAGKSRDEQVLGVSAICSGYRSQLPCLEIGLDDWSLLKTSGNFTFNYYVEAAALPWKNMPSTNMRCFQVGFGITSLDITPPHQPEFADKARYFEVERGNCNLWGISNNDMTRMCHIALKENQIACAGDSGGPVLCQLKGEQVGRWYVTALHSVGDGRCSTYFASGPHMLNVRVRGIMDDMMSSCPIH